MRFIILIVVSSFVFFYPLHFHSHNKESLLIEYSMKASWAKKKKKKKRSYNRRKKASQALLKAGHPSVELTIKTQPRMKAKVYHGKEYLGRTPMSLKWAKDTGPIDIVVRAGGYITVNSRLYTHRNDSVTVNMFKKDEAHLVFGYKKKIEKPSEEDTENQDNAENSATSTDTKKANTAKDTKTDATKTNANNSKDASSAKPAQ